MPRKVGVLAWLNVVLVGALVLGIVFGLRLYPRLNSGQKTVNDLKPNFTPARAQGDRAGINFVSDAVNVLDPITTASGSGVPEVPQLIAFVAQKTGLSQAAVLNLLSTRFPHTTALLESIPLSATTGELPGFVSFVATALHTTPAGVVALLKSNFPALYQVVVNLPAVTSGWDNVPAITGLTRFNGSPVMTAPQVRDYFSGDVVPVVEKNVSNFHRVSTYFPPVKDIAPLLTIIGAIAVLYGLIMMLRSATKTVKRKEGTVEWTIVLLLGVIVLGLVFGAQIYPRLDGGSHLLRDARPAFTPARVSGDVGGVNFISDVVNLANPIMNAQGGASAEVPQLLAAVAKSAKVSPTALLAEITTHFPHTAHLLEALPLSSVNAEIPGILSLLHVALNASPAAVLTTLQGAVPGLAQSIVNLPLVVNGWDNNPAGALTRFDGSAVTTAPQLRDYFRDDVVASVGKAAPDFRKLDGTAPDLSLFPGLLTILGVLVVFYAIIMLVQTALPDPDEELAKLKARGPGGRRAAGASAVG